MTGLGLNHLDPQGIGELTEQFNRTTPAGSKAKIIAKQNRFWLHGIQQRPVAVAGEVVVRPMMYVALSYDHRIIDGQQSVKFLVRLKQLVEDPARLILEV